MRHALEAIRFYSIIGIVNLFVGIAFLSLSLPRPAVVTEYSPVLQKPVIAERRQARQGIPTRINVPSLGIDVKVGLGSYNPKDQSWTLDTSRAFYADISVPANDSNGTTLVYGHARAAVFSLVPQAKKGTKATVYTNTGYIFRYEYKTKHEVEPSDLSLLKVNGPPMLLLQTCSGPWDVYRTMVLFTLVAVERA